METKILKMLLKHGVRSAKSIPFVNVATTKGVKAAVKEEAKTMIKDGLYYQTTVLPYKAMNKAKLGIKNAIGKEVESMMGLPTELKDEFKRTSTHEAGSRQVFAKPQLNQYDYFRAYYDQQINRTNSNVNLAQQFSKEDLISKNNKLY